MHPNNNRSALENQQPDFQALARLSALLSKSFAADIFRLLLAYSSISASEAASRLNLHIKTAQDFLEGLEKQGVISRREVSEKKRPYYRYTLEQDFLRIEFDLNRLKPTPKPSDQDERMLIREKKNAGAVFKTSPKTGALTALTFYTGRGRSRTERRVQLTENQGRFLFHLPFPTEKGLSVRAILDRAGIDAAFEPEVRDLVGFLIEHGIIEHETRG